MRPRRSFNLLASGVLVLAMTVTLYARPRVLQQPQAAGEPAPEASAAGVPQIIYVDADGTCTGSCDPTCGTTWANAFASLQEAADCAPTTGDVEIWVAEGTYGKLTLTGFDNDLNFYGGFVGTETVASQSDPFAHRTFISGGNADRCIVLTDNHSFFRGFHVVEGMSQLPNWGGAAMRLTESNPTFVNCVFTRNNSEVVGAVGFVQGGTLTFVGCRFHDNDGGWGGGAFYTLITYGSFVNCVFRDNTAWEGGVISGSYSPMTFDNCTFVNNSATIGDGGVAYDELGVMTFNNCILWNNFDGRTNVEIANNPFVTERSTVRNCIIRDGYSAGTNVTTDDPLFVYPSGNNLRLTTGSDGYNMADESLIPVDTYDLDWDGDTTEKVPDLDLVQRPQGAGSDIGAYEYDARPLYADFIPKNRYLSIVTDNPGTDVAIRVTLLHSDDFPGAEGSHWWVSSLLSVADGASTIYVARLGCNPKFIDWSGIDQIHIGDAEIVPGAAYRVDAVSVGSDLCTAGSYSPGVLLRTVDVWGDVAGPFDDTLDIWAPPDGVVDDDPETEPDDNDAVLDKFSSTPWAPPLVWCDVEPNVPDTTIGTDDAIAVQTSQADPNHAYPYAGPVSCSCAGGCCVYGKCCTSGGSCSNTTQADCSATWTSGTMCESASPACSGGGGGPPRGGGE